MKFKDTIISKLILGVIFTLFMLLVSLVFALVLIPVFLVQMGVVLIGGSTSIGTILLSIIGLLIFLASFFVVGWAVFYFYKKNVFSYKKR